MDTRAELIAPKVVSRTPFEGSPFHAAAMCGDEIGAHLFGMIQQCSSDYSTLEGLENELATIKAMLATLPEEAASGSRHLLMAAERMYLVARDQALDERASELYHDTMAEARAEARSE